MMKKTIVAATIALIMLPTIGHAGKFTVRGDGTASCGTWINDGKGSGGRLQAMSWIMGFITAINISRSPTVPDSESLDVLNNADRQGVEVWITNYCSQHPLKDVWQASIEMVTETTGKGFFD